MPYPKYRKSPPLQNEILKDVNNSIGAAGIVINQITRLDHNVRNAEAMLRRIRGYIACRAGSTASMESIRFGLTLDSSDHNNPTFANRDLEDQNLWEQTCTASRDTSANWDNPAFLHFDMTLSIKIPYDRSVFFTVMNEGAVTDFYAFIIRLFWSLI